ncbi:MAG: hypothetical protein K0R18_127 [Bacillales bacterium]|jgi:hypothetical protein|nr:hypothetical protein [Bacillales bacterium]
MATIEAPRIMIYARVLNNIDNSQIEGYSDIRDKKGSFDFGTINGITGGESSSVVEFDIWNNEPAFSSGMLAEINADATDCVFTAWDNSNCNSVQGITGIDNRYFIRARSLADNDYAKAFTPIGGDGSNYFKNSVTPESGPLELGTLSGRAGGDRVKIQTKIFIPAATGLLVRKTFVFGFHYNFE